MALQFPPASCALRHSHACFGTCSMESQIHSSTAHQEQYQNPEGSHTFDTPSRSGIHDDHTNMLSHCSGLPVRPRVHCA